MYRTCEINKLYFSVTYLTGKILFYLVPPFNYTAYLTSKNGSQQASYDLSVRRANSLLSVRAIWWGPQPRLESVQRSVLKNFH